MTKSRFIPIILSVIGASCQGSQGKKAERTEEIPVPFDWAGLEAASSVDLQGRSLKRSEYQKFDSNNKVTDRVAKIFNERGLLIEERTEGSLNQQTTHTYSHNSQGQLISQHTDSREGNGSRYVSDARWDRDKEGRLTFRTFKSQDFNADDKEIRFNLRENQFRFAADGRIQELESLWETRSAETSSFDTEKRTYEYGEGINVTITTESCQKHYSHECGSESIRKAQTTTATDANGRLVRLLTTDITGGQSKGVAETGFNWSENSVTSRDLDEEHSDDPWRIFYSHDITHADSLQQNSPKDVQKCLLSDFGVHPSSCFVEISPSSVWTPFFNTARPAHAHFDLKLDTIVLSKYSRYFGRQSPLVQMDFNRTCDANGERYFHCVIVETDFNKDNNIQLVVLHDLSLNQRDDGTWELKVKSDWPANPEEFIVQFDKAKLYISSLETRKSNSGEPERIECRRFYDTSRSATVFDACLKNDRPFSLTQNHY